MSIRLAVDATSDRLSLAAGRDGGGAASAELEGARRHAGALLPLIEDVLHRVDATARDVTTVVVADGPGSFTGIRVAFAAGKALAAEGAVLMTAPSLMVRAAEGAGRNELVLAVSSALRGELYAGLWRFDLPHQVVVIMPPRTIMPRDISSIPPFDRAVGDGPEDFLRALGATRAWPEASTLLRLIGVPGAVTTIESPLEFEPQYGRPAEAAAKWEREHGRPLPDSPGHDG